MLQRKHEQYFKRCLVMLPQQAQIFDSSHVGLVYFSLLGLSLLGVQINDKDRYIKWIEKLMVQNKTGFRGSLNHTQNSQFYDRPNLSATFFCLSILALLNDSSIVNKLDRKGVAAFIQRSQCPNGSFRASTGTETSIRHVFTALAVMKLLKIENNAVLNKAASFIRSCQTEQGGFSESKDAEPHSGLTFCAVAALALCGSPDCAENTTRFLVGRILESGGFNGRLNKPGDSCYSFWNVAALEILHPGHELLDRNKACEFLLERTQNKIIGGFAKLAPEDDEDEDTPDLLHSALSLAALSLMGACGLCKVSPLLIVPEESLEFVKEW